MYDDKQLPFNLESFKTAYDTSPQAFCIVYVSKSAEEYEDFTFIYANKAYETMSGFAIDNLIGHTYSEIIGSRSEQWNKIYGDSAYLGLTQSKIVSGPEIEAYVSIQCFQVAKGYCASNVLDVTKEIEAVEKAKTEKQKSIDKILTEREMYQTLLDQSSAMITVIDAESFKVVYANAAANSVTKNIEGGYLGSVCYKSIARGEEPCKNCLLVRENAPKEEVKTLSYGGRVYKMIYKLILWNGKKALMEYSEDVTEQKLLSDLSAKNTKQLADIINNLPTGIVVYKVKDKNYQIVQVNPSFCEMLDLDDELIVGIKGKKILSLIHPDDVGVLLDAAKRMAKPGEKVSFEFRAKPKNRENYIWLSAEGRSSAQPDGSVDVYIGYKDITDSKDKELEFQQKVDFISNLNDESIISKGRHNITKNRVLSLVAKKTGAVLGDTGEKYDDLLPNLIETALDDEKKVEIKNTLNRENLIIGFAKGLRDFTIDYRRKMNGDKIIWATIKGSLYEEPSSHDIIAFLHSYDNTDKIQEELIINRLSTLEYGLLALIDVKTNDYKTIHIKNVSPADYKKIKGNYSEMIERRYKIENILGNREILHKQILLDTIISELETKNIYEVEFSMTTPEGAFRRMRFHYSYLDDTKQTIIFFTSDITEYYEREREQMQKIEEALRQAQEANRAKTAFFSRMSHDMRTPMNGILGMTMLSENENNISVIKENMRKIEESGQYLLSLINDTLDIQRIESGKMKIEPQIISTNESVNNILDMIRTAAEAKGVNLRFDPGNAELNWYVRTDPVRIKQIFVNLLSNAVKFTPPGGTVELASRLVSRNGMISHDVFTVSDTGIGMSEEYLKNGIFKPFSQENNSVTANYAGSGLGLSIAKSLIELMGGTIEVESELGVGTTFTINLDLERVDPEEAKQLLHSKKIKTDNMSAVLKGKKILLAEDHPLNAEITIKLLKAVGCEVVWKENGEKALECFKDSILNDFDAVLMDIRMPVMDGLEATRCIRALGRADAKTVPIIAMTANAYDEDVKKSLKAGMNSHLGKPVDPSLLYETLAESISK